MLIDKQNMFSDAQAITASAASDNYIDIQSARNLGVGEELYLVFVVTTAFTDAGSDSTVTPKLQTDDNTSFSSAADLRTYDTFAALSAAGTKKVYKLESVTDAGSYERYLRVYYTVANGNLTTGAISAFLAKDAQAWKAYASGYTVL